MLGASDIEQLFQSLFETSPVAVFVTRPDGTILRANPVACRMLQRTEAEIQHLGRRGVVVDDEALRRFIRDREVTGAATGELRWVRPDGSELTVEATSALIPAPNGAYAYIMGRDVTERRRAEEALRRYELLVAHSRDIMLFVRAGDGRILEANAAAIAAYGYSLDELNALTIADLRSPSTQGELAAHMNAANQAGLRFETEHRRKDGSTFPVEVSSTGAVLGGERVLLSIVRDITERRRAEEALRESDRRKGEFLGVLSHELRNPLAPIRTAVHLLQVLPPDAPQAARAKEILRRQTDHLVRLVDDLLDVTRISRGKLTLQRQRVDLRDVVRRTCEDHQPIFEPKHIRLSVELPPEPLPVDADPVRLSQALGNLLHNACKFTPEGGAVLVTAGASDGLAEVRVRDTGVGLAPGHVEHMFEPFAQAENTLARTQGGLGLGLSLVRSLMELHGGTATGSSRGAGQGAEFVLRLRCAPSA